MELKKREEIMKALECYIKKPHISECEKGCIYYEKSFGWYCCALPLEDTLIENALALIKELTEEIKDLEADYDRIYEQAEADIHGNMADGGTSCHWCMDKTKADTVKRMKTLIENGSSWFVTTSNGIVTNRTYQLTEDKLCQIAKELLEENKHDR